MLRECQKRSFVRSYLERTKELEGSKDSVTDDEVDHLFEVAEGGEMVSASENYPPESEHSLF